MAYFTSLESIISAEELARKWGVDSWTLGEITRKDRICTYGLRDVRQTPDGKKIYLCSGPYAQGMPYTEEFNTRVYDLSLYVFKTEDIERYEDTHPEYLLPSVTEEKPEYILAKNFLNQFEAEREKAGYEVVEALQTELAEAKQKIALLEEQLTEGQAAPFPLREQGEEGLTPQQRATALKYSTEHAATARTEAATEAKQEKTLQNWQAAFRVMLLIALECKDEEPRKRTKNEFRRMAEKYGGTLTQAQLNFLRDCLPSEYVNREGGPTIQN
jgi:hypothetical protein